MTFGEKLAELTADENKAKLARRAGLPPNAISDYINKGYLPRLDTALALAKVLDVPLDALADPDAEWPPRKPEKPNPANLSDDELMEELARRYRQQVLRFRARAEVIQHLDWRTFSEVLLKMPPTEDLPPKLQEVRAVFWMMTSEMYFAPAVYNPKLYANERHAQMPGSDVPVEQLDLSYQIDRVSSFVRSNPFAKAVSDYFGLVQQHTDGDADRARAGWEKWRADVAALLDTGKGNALDSPRSNSGRKRKA